MTIKEKISLFPHSPGVYRYYDSQGNVIYVGKAKDLHNRVAQYFVPPDRLSRKTALMVGKIADAQFSVVDTEADALLLENNLIKQYKPRYNILLKDDKTYPWICVTKEPYPRVFLTRKMDKGLGEYFGPYSSVMHARALMDLFGSLFPLRTCRQRLNADSVLRHKLRPCLNYHIGKCRGACIGGISAKEYGDNIEEIKALLKGGTSKILTKYKLLMQAAADNLEFETAQLYKTRMQAIQNHYSKSIISSAGGGDMDVFGLVSDNTEAFGNFLRLREGNVVQSLNLGFKLGIEEPGEAVLTHFIGAIREKFGELSRDIIVPCLPDMEFGGSRFHVPAKGDKFALLELSTRNAGEMRLNMLKQREHSDPDAYYQKIVEDLQKALAMPVAPEHIECFDNSNIQGTNPVASCVVFRDGRPSKSDYRHFIIKTVVGANDYASMKEVVNRRYARMLEEAPDDLPQLVIVDGGKGQLAFAFEALCELGLHDKITLVSLAERMEEVYRVGDPYPLFLDKNSQALRLLQRLRDEAHRFGITHHRNRRSKTQVDSVLRHIKGVGPKVEERLLMHFGSVARISASSEDALAALVGKALAARIKESLAPKS